MRSFEDICREYGKKPEEVERDLYSMLRHPEVTIVGSNDLERDYFGGLVSFLHLNGYLIRDWPTNKRTRKGEIAITRGYIAHNIKKNKRNNIRELVSALLDAFLPRLKSIWEFIFKKID